MNIFSEESYKGVLTRYLMHRKRARASYTFDAMAEACGVQKTYLSKVLKHKGNLSHDQVFAASEFLKMRPIENEFLMALYHFETSSLPRRRQHLKQKIEELRRKALTTDANLDLEISKAANDSIAEYYSDPMYCLIHIFLTIERYQRDVSALEQELGFKSEQLSKYLDRLENMGIIKQEGPTWKVMKDSLHLPEGSSYIKAQRTLLRLKALEKIEKLSANDYYSFSVVFSTEETIQKEIRERFLQFLEGVQKLVQKGKEKEVFQMNFDLLKWS